MNGLAYSGVRFSRRIATPVGLNRSQWAASTRSSAFKRQGAVKADKVVGVSELVIGRLQRAIVLEPRVRALPFAHINIARRDVACGYQLP